jgi:hypothetical protein
VLFTKKKEKNIDYIKILLVCWFVETCTLGPNLISQFVVPPVARVIFSITTGIVFVLAVAGKIKLKNALKQKKSPPRLAVAGIFLGFLIYNVGLITAFVNSSSTNIEDLISRLLLFATLTVASIYMTENVFKKCMDLYSQILTIFSICAILVFLVVLILRVPPVNEFTAPMADRVYQNYIIAFVEAEVDTLAGFKRAGSFYDEPGTFAMFLMPALFWVILVNPSKIMIFSMLISLLLTFSVGGWAAFAISFGYVVRLCPELISRYILEKYKFITKVFLVLGVILCINFLLKLSDVSWLFDYFNFKFDSGDATDKVSSVGTRQNEIDSFFNTLWENPLGYGIKSKSIPVFSVGLMGSSIEGGLLGVVGYLVCFMGIIGHLVNKLVSNKVNYPRMTIAILGGNLSLVIMSFQRIDMLTFYTGIFMLSFMLNSRDNLDENELNIEKIQAYVRPPKAKLMG